MSFEIQIPPIHPEVRHRKRKREFAIIEFSLPRP